MRIAHTVRNTTHTIIGFCYVLESPACWAFSIQSAMQMVFAVCTLYPILQCLGGNDDDDDDDSFGVDKCDAMDWITCDLDSFIFSHLLRNAYPHLRFKIQFIHNPPDVHTPHWRCEFIPHVRRFNSSRINYAKRIDVIIVFRILSLCRNVVWQWNRNNGFRSMIHSNCTIHK